MGEGNVGSSLGSSSLGSSSLGSSIGRERPGSGPGGAGRLIGRRAEGSPDAASSGTTPAAPARSAARPRPQGPDLEAARGVLARGSDAPAPRVRPAPTTFQPHRSAPRSAGAGALSFVVPLVAGVALVGLVIYALSAMQIESRHVVRGALVLGAVALRLMRRAFTA
jgi:hypothetical protein